MNFFLALLASIFIALAWLVPIHYRPWVTYTGELYSFLALFALIALLLKDKLHIPKISLGLVVLSTIPLVQYCFGEIFFFSNAFMSMVYILGFWFAVLVGYNLSQGKWRRETTFTSLSYVFLLSGVVTALMAICQWLNLDEVIPGIARLVNARPYANFAQPNNMATFLLMALLACLYLYETKKLKTVLLLLCGFVMLIGLALSQSRTSWVGFACAILYLLYQQFKGAIAIRWYSLFAWTGVFVGLIFLLPMLAGYISQLSDTEIKSVSVAKRATGDMSRLAIWQQMLHAIQHQPWFGYGWFQTGVAYTTISEFYPGPVWIRSAHNFILDFILWNGVILGVPFLAYFSYWGVQLQKFVNSKESIIAILMIGVFVVHAMLEFPQNYAYFLLPVGFILGTLQAQKLSQKDWVLSARFTQVSFVVSLIFLAWVFRDYDVSSTQLSNAMKYEKTPEKHTDHGSIYLLNEFQARIEWTKLNPQTKLSSEQLEQISHIVLLYPTSYNLYKFAKTLAFNGDEAGARHQLKMLKILRNKDISYEQLVGSEVK